MAALDDALVGADLMEPTMGHDLVRASRRIDRKLRAAGRPSKLIVYPPHGEDGHSLFFAVGPYWADVEMFLNDHL